MGIALMKEATLCYYLVWRLYSTMLYSSGKRDKTGKAIS